MDNKDVVRAYVDAFNAGDFDAAVAQFAPDAVIYGVMGHGPPHVVRTIWEELRASMSMQLEILGMVAEGSSVAVRFRETGRFVGRFRGLQGHEPTNRTFEIVSMEWFDLADGRIIRRWGARDSASITRQVLTS
ncbi:MAG: nuclear transport factor 2 family protein [Acetobacteraceae bacterium]|nr:nuclear transport factor 2 family protein [Acetobacteraceae bacterium]